MEDTNQQNQQNKEEKTSRHHSKYILLNVCNYVKFDIITKEKHLTHLRSINCVKKIN